MEKNVEIWDTIWKSGGNLEILRIFGNMEKIEIWKQKFGNLKKKLEIREEKFGKLEKKLVKIEKNWKLKKNWNLGNF